MTGTGDAASALDASAAGCAAQDEIALHAAVAVVTGSKWMVRACPAGEVCAGGSMLVTGAGREEVLAPLANPADHVELTFSPEGHVDYHLWIRLKATDDSENNDSVWVQFESSVDPTNDLARWRIGSTSAFSMELKEYSFPLDGWGWADNDATFDNSIGMHVRFERNGPQKIRIQMREDGAAFDQIILSPCQHLDTRGELDFSSDAHVFPENAGSLCVTCDGRCGAIPSTDPQCQSLSCGDCSTESTDTVCRASDGVCVAPACTPETDQELCDAIGAMCGSIPYAVDCSNTTRINVPCQSQCTPAQSCSGTTCVTAGGEVCSPGDFALGNCTGKVPLPDLKGQYYQPGGASLATHPDGFEGGLYEGGSNVMPADHAQAGLDFARQIQRLDINGNPSATGKMILLAPGYSAVAGTMSSGGWVQSPPPFAGLAPTGDLKPNGFFGLVWSNAHGTNNNQVGANTIAVDVDGAFGSIDTSGGSGTGVGTGDKGGPLILQNGACAGCSEAWGDPDGSVYTAIANGLLTAFQGASSNYPRGLSTQQVQVIWTKIVKGGPTLADGGYQNSAARAEAKYAAQQLRAFKANYPNIKLVYLSSRPYWGWAFNSDGTSKQREPAGYENGLGIKWVIQEQINQMRGLPPDPEIGPLRYDTPGHVGDAPWVAWGPYLWIDGIIPRGFDGRAHIRADFEPDGTHPGDGGPKGTWKGNRLLMAEALLQFFSHSQFNRCWFLKSATCPTSPTGIPEPRNGLP